MFRLGVVILIALVAACAPAAQPAPAPQSAEPDGAPPAVRASVQLTVAAQAATAAAGSQATPPPGTPTLGPASRPAGQWRVVVPSIASSSRLWGMGVDHSGTIYVANGNGTVFRYGSDGRPLGTWDIDGSAITVGVTFDPQGNLLFAAQNRGYVGRVAPDGRLTARWGKHDDRSRGLMAEWVPGYAPAEFSEPHSVAVDGAGTIYVADTLNNRIQKLSPSGSPLGQWGQLGSHPGQLEQPVAVTVDAGGMIYTGEINGRVQKFTPDGKVVATWSSTSPSDVSVGGSAHFLTGIAVDRAGRVYVSDTNNNFVKQFSPDGQLLATWAERGTDPGEFYNPLSLAIDPNGRVLVLEGNRVQALDPG